MPRLGGDPTEYPNPAQDLDGFQKEIAKRLSKEDLVWNPLKVSTAFD